MRWVNEQKISSQCKKYKLRKQFHIAAFRWVLHSARQNFNFGGERVHGEDSYERFPFIVLSRSEREEKERKSERWMPWL